MSNLVDHARRELELCGQMEEDPAYAQSVISAIAALTAYDGHSGGSMFAAIEQIKRLLQFRTLSPLTSNSEEWFDHGEMSGERLWQNKRDGAAFSTDGGQTWYFVDGRSE